MDIIKTKHVYLDRESKRKKDAKPRRKYKIAGTQFTVENVHSFFLLTSSCPTYIPLELIVEIRKCDYKSKLKNHLNCKCSYIDIINTETIPYKEISQKFINNLFVGVAEITDLKYQEIIGLYPKVIKLNFFKSETKKRLFYKATRQVNEDILRNMGLRIT